MGNYGGGGGEGVTRDEYLVSDSDTGGIKSQLERCCTRIYSNGIPTSDIRGKIMLELLSHGPGGQPARVQDALYSLRLLETDRRTME
jgi:hypothetical protein